MPKNERLRTAGVIALIIVGSSALFAALLPFTFMKTFWGMLTAQAVAAVLGFSNYILWKKVGQLTTPRWLRRFEEWSPRIVAGLFVAAWLAWAAYSWLTVPD